MSTYTPDEAARLLERVVAQLTKHVVVVVVDTYHHETTVSAREGVGPDEADLFRPMREAMTVVRVAAATLLAAGLFPDDDTTISPGRLLELDS